MRSTWFGLMVIAKENYIVSSAHLDDLQVLCGDRGHRIVRIGLRKQICRIFNQIRSQTAPSQFYYTAAATTGGFQLDIFLFLSRPLIDNTLRPT